jgi:phosphoribosylanthranilate isomerase
MPSNRLFWKVCGMRDPGNIRQVAMLRPDFLGFIFYPGSPRYVGENFPKSVMDNLGNIKKAGVFVNQETDFILEKVRKYSLDFVQLHGDEPPAQVEEISKDVQIIKVFSGNKPPDSASLRAYEPFIRYWLVDTRTDTKYGGTGSTFDWDVLKELSLNRDIILSGGIGPVEAGMVKKLGDARVKGIDVNSKAEAAPGIKNTGTLKMIYDELFS